ncbi:hypothetical protein AVDCRST_MAG84-235, partial [uncultured Microcoleus sp.]
GGVTIAASPTMPSLFQQSSLQYAFMFLRAIGS